MGDLIGTRLVGLLLRRLVFLFLISNCLHGFCVTGTQQQQLVDACQHSEQIYDYDASVMRLPHAPTRFRLMTSRYLLMIQAVRGYQCTGTVTVGFDGHRYLQNGRSDDPGMMELIPTISRWTGMSLENTYDAVILAVVMAGLLVGYAGFWQLYPDRKLRWVGVAVFLCIGIAELRVADEYMFQISPLIGGIPWLLHFALKRRATALTITAVLLAFCCSGCSLVRSGSLAICMTFLLTTFVARYRVQRPFLPMLLIVIACLPALLFERSIIARRNVAMAKVGDTAWSENSHPVWHTIYIGMGFIPNSEVPEYKDAVGGSKVRSIDPTVAYTSPRYEAILRHETWSLLKRRPMLVIGTVAAKAGIVVLLASILLYPVRRLIFVEKPVVWMDVAFILTIGVSAINGIVAVPRSSYLLTLVCLAVLYSSIKLCRRALSPERTVAYLKSTAPR